MNRVLSSPQLVFPLTQGQPHTDIACSVPLWPSPPESHAGGDYSSQDPECPAQGSERPWPLAMARCALLKCSGVRSRTTPMPWQDSGKGLHFSFRATKPAVVPTHPRGTVSRLLSQPQWLNRSSPTLALPSSLLLSHRFDLGAVTLGRTFQSRPHPNSHLPPPERQGGSAGS